MRTRNYEQHGYKTLGAASDQEGDRVWVESLHHPAREEPAYEVVLSTSTHGDLTWNAADPLERAELRKLVDALKAAISEGSVVETTGEPIPAEPERCRCGLVRGTEHLRNCLERCQDCRGDVDGPNRCRCRG